MKYLLFLLIFFVSNNNNQLLANENKCDGFNKFTMEFIKCNTDQLKEKAVLKRKNLKEKTLSVGKNLKEKTISTSKNIVKDTKNYQSKEWSEEKKKLNKVKEKVLGK